MTSDTTTYAAPFLAYADPALIARASSFFDNKTSSIVRELLQNSRRSGATAVRLDQQGSRWIYKDNGPGCEPCDLLGLGASRWTEEVKATETPAGCGFFSLARRSPTVKCPARGWLTDLTEDHFNGKAQIHSLRYAPEPTQMDGLVIEFDAGTADRYADDLAQLARYLPFSFVLNGTSQPSHQQFLGAAAGHHMRRTVRFAAGSELEVSLLGSRVELEVSLLGSRADFLACYHGHVVRIAEELPSFAAVGRGDGLDSYYAAARVMVTSEAALPLELPQRNAIIQGDEYKEIVRQARCIALELAVEHLDDTITNSPQQWLTARRNWGYTGPILYTRYIGREVIRPDGNDVSDYSLESDEGRDEHFVAYGDVVTFDEFENDPEWKIAPSDELLAIIAQTTLPSVLLSDGAGSAIGLDTDVYYAPGLRLLRTLKQHGDLGNIAEGAEGYEWYARYRRLQKERGAWDEDVRVIAWCDDQAIRFDAAYDPGHGGLDVDNLYDHIELHIGEDLDDEDLPRIVLPAAALFDLPGDRYSSHVEFIATRAWFEGGIDRFIGEVVAALVRLRLGNDDYEDRDVNSQTYTDNLTEAFAVFDDPEALYKDRILGATEAKVRYALDKLPGPYSEVVVRFRIGPGSSKYSSYTIAESSCEFVAAAKPETPAGDE